MKKLLLTLPILALASCASMQNASVSDYDGDGVISDAESRQYHKQAGVQERNVYTESVKRRNAVNTTGDALEGVQNISRLRNTFRHGF
jgi:ribosomal protein S5